MGENQGRGAKRGPGTRRESRGLGSVLRPGTGGVPRLGRKVGLGNAEGEQSWAEEGEGGPRSGPLVGRGQAEAEVSRRYLQRSSKTLLGISRRLVSMMKTRSRRSASRLRGACTVEGHADPGPRTLEPALPGPRGWAEARGGALGPRPLRGNGPVGSWETRACARLANETFVYWSVGSNQASGCSVPAQKTNFPPPLTERTQVCLRLRVLGAFYCASGSFEFLFSDTSAPQRRPSSSGLVTVVPTLPEPTEQALVSMATKPRASIKQAISRDCGHQVFCTHALHRFHHF